MAVDVIITHKDQTLIASGTFITFDEGETVLDLHVDNDRVQIVFNIVNDKTEFKNDISGKVALPDQFRVNIRNYRQVMGNPVVGPVELGRIAGRAFYLLFSVRGAKSDRAKVITYSVYIEGGI